MNGHVIVLRERERYLRERIEAKRIVGWETKWDEREHNALQWAIETLRNKEGDDGA